MILYFHLDYRKEKYTEIFQLVFPYYSLLVLYKLFLLFSVLVT